MVVDYSTFTVDEDLSAIWCGNCMEAISTAPDYNNDLASYIALADAHRCKNTIDGQVIKRELSR